MSKKTLEHNLELFAKEHPVQAIHIQNVDVSSYRFLDKQKNLKAPWGKIYLKDPEQEAKEWFDSLDLKGERLLYVFGIGLGAYYEALKGWLKANPERHVAFFEDDLAILKKFFELTAATEILNDPQVSVCYLKDLKDEEGVWETLYWSFPLTPYKITALNSYALHKKTKVEDFEYNISYRTAKKNALLDEYLKYGMGFFRNFYPNMLLLHHSYWGNTFFGKFKNAPAIICGAGPSLEKQLPLLGKLKNNALIFAGGSALNALISHGVTPHFGAGIDPNPFYLTRLSKTESLKIPFFYRSRMYHEAFCKVNGPRLYISGAGGYDVSDWYEEKFDIKSEDYLDEGHNVVNFCTEVAARMGCNPIIFIGMDLAYTNMKAYTSGTPDEKVDVSKEKLLNATDEEERGIIRSDIYGNSTITLWKWISESDWLGEYSKNHPELTIINATEGGIGFPGIPNIPFQEVISKYLRSKQEFKIEKAVEEAKKPNITKEKVEQITRDLEKSLKNCLQRINEMKDELEAEFKRPDTDGTVRSGKFALAEEDFMSEIGYKYVLEIFHQVYARVQSRKTTALRLNKQKNYSERQLAEEKIRLQLEKLRFLSNVAEANIYLIDYSFGKKT